MLILFIYISFSVPNVPLKAAGTGTSQHNVFFYLYIVYVLMLSHLVYAAFLQSTQPAGCFELKSPFICRLYLENLILNLINIII